MHALCLCRVKPRSPVEGQHKENYRLLSLKGMARAGRITHHDEVSRLKRVYELVKEAQQQIAGKSFPHI